MWTKQNSLLYNNYLCTYDLYGPVRNVFDAGRSIMWASGRGLAPGNGEFLVPCEMARADWRVPFGAQTPPPPLLCSFHCLLSLVLSFIPCLLSAVCYPLLLSSVQLSPTPCLYHIVPYFYPLTFPCPGLPIPCLLSSFPMNPVAEP
jgi:hypothetical protein